MTVIRGPYFSLNEWHVVLLDVASFFNSATYENILDYEGFPQTLEPIWILGFKYSLLHGMYISLLILGFKYSLLHGMYTANLFSMYSMLFSVATPATVHCCEYSQIAEATVAQQRPIR